MASESEELAAELRHEFDVTRRELDEISEEVDAAEARLVELARQDIQVSDLREALDETRQRVERLRERERTLRATFDAAVAQLPHRPDRTH